MTHLQILCERVPDTLGRHWYFTADYKNDGLRAAVHIVAWRDGASAAGEQKMVELDAWRNAQVRAVEIAYRERDAFVATMLGTESPR